MKILAVDSAIGTCSVAVFDGDVSLSLKEEMRVSKQAESLVMLVEAALDEAKLGYGDIDLLVSTVGPGSFTGLRIGMTVIKGIALVTQLPTIGISSLQTIALAGQNTNGGEIVSILNAMRSQLYIQRFDSSACPLSDAELINMADIESYVKDGDIIVGNAEEIITDKLSSEVRYVYTMPNAKEAAMWAASLYSEIPESQDLVPLYIRQPDAKLPKQG